MLLEELLLIQFAEELESEHSRGIQQALGSKPGSIPP